MPFKEQESLLIKSVRMGLEVFVFFQKTQESRFLIWNLSFSSNVLETLSKQNKPVRLRIPVPVYQVWAPISSRDQLAWSWFKRRLGAGNMKARDGETATTQGPSLSRSQAHQFYRRASKWQGWRVQIPWTLWFPDFGAYRELFKILMHRLHPAQRILTCSEFDHHYTPARECLSETLSLQSWPHRKQEEYFNFKYWMCSHIGQKN